MLGLNIAMVTMVVGCGDEKNNSTGNNTSNQEVVQIQETVDEEDTEKVAEEVVQENVEGDSIVEEVEKNQTNTNNSSNNQENYISEVDAKEIALNHAGVNEADTKYLTVKFEYDNGIAEYEIEWDVDRVEYEYEINATTGDIIGFSKDLD